jgi:2,5-diamino-6-(ribosylamino)-4(3H)-pyrimidinone 5'-phosphate reductase
MLPKVVMHNAVSLDGAIRGFPIDLGEYYALAGEFGAEVSLVGSATAKMGIEEFMPGLAPEAPEDCRKPEAREGDERGYWAVVDSKGELEGKLHAFRRAGYAKDVVVLAAKKTPKKYLDYLSAREYDCFVAGEERVDLRRALELLRGKLKAKTVVVDSGGVLNAALLEAGLVDTVSLVVAPFIVGRERCAPLFRALSLKESIRLKLVKQAKLESGCVHLVYDVKKAAD